MVSISAPLMDVFLILMELLNVMQYLALTLRSVKTQVSKIGHMTRTNVNFHLLHKPKASLE